MIPTAEQRQALTEWLEGRPAIIAKMAELCPPWHEYTLTTDTAPDPSIARYRIYSYNEDGTVQVVKMMTPRAAILLFAMHPELSPAPPITDDEWIDVYDVFGLDPADLVPIEAQP